MRIVESFRKDGKPMNRTLYSMGKVEDYSTGQLEKIAKKTLRSSRVLKLEDVFGVNPIHETQTGLNYGVWPPWNPKGYWETFLEMG